MSVSRVMLVAALALLVALHQGSCAVLHGSSPILGRAQVGSEKGPNRFMQEKVLSVRGGMQVQVQTFNGNTITVECEPDESVESLMSKIQAKEGVPPGQQRIVFDGKQLDALKSLSDYDIDDDSVLHLVLRLRGGL